MAHILFYSEIIMFIIFGHPSPERKHRTVQFSPELRLALHWITSCLLLKPDWQNWGCDVAKFYTYLSPWKCTEIMLVHNKQIASCIKRMWSRTKHQINVWKKRTARQASRYTTTWNYLQNFIRIITNTQLAQSAVPPTALVYFRSISRTRG
jgi:hypothetical protein